MKTQLDLQFYTQKVSKDLILFFFQEGEIR